MLDRLVPRRSNIISFPFVGLTVVLAVLNCTLHTIFVHTSFHTLVSDYYSEDLHDFNVCVYPILIDYNYNATNHKLAFINFDHNL